MCTPDTDFEVPRGRSTIEPTNRRGADGKVRWQHRNPEAQARNLFNWQEEHCNDIRTSTTPPTSEAKDPVNPDQEEATPWWDR